MCRRSWSNSGGLPREARSINKSVPRVQPWGISSEVLLPAPVMHRRLSLKLPVRLRDYHEYHMGRLEIVLGRLQACRKPGLGVIAGIFFLGLDVFIHSQSEDRFTSPSGLLL